MTIQPIADFRSPFTSKFGIPRQSGIVDGLWGTIVLRPEYRSAEAIRGLEEFDYLWLVWEFSANVSATKHSTVRPPRLGGNRHVGVFATRSPFRPNNLGLSSVRLLAINDDRSIDVSGADLMDGTPIYDIKPYITFTDSHPEARSGFVETDKWHTLNVDMPEELRKRLPQEYADALIKVLEQDPRPQYHNSTERIYGMPFAGCDVRFIVEEDTLHVVDITTV